MKEICCIEKCSFAGRVLERQQSSSGDGVGPPLILGFLRKPRKTFVKYNPGQPNKGKYQIPNASLNSFESHVMKAPKGGVFRASGLQPYVNPRSKREVLSIILSFLKPHHPVPSFAWAPDVSMAPYMRQESCHCSSLPSAGSSNPPRTINPES